MLKFHYAYIIKGKQRKLVIERMDRPMSVTELKKKTNLSLSETSRVLRQLQKQGLTICITPQNVQGRIYQLTKRGEAVKKGFLNN